MYKKYTLPSDDKVYETVILANGEFPEHAVPLKILDDCKYLVCCDGAVNNLPEGFRLPDAVVGDCDSLSEENKILYAGIIHRIAEQETNDLTKAVNFCLGQGRSNITILGATGKREDHTIGNISLLCEYMECAEVEMITNYGVFNGIKETSMFESYPGQQISLFCIDRCEISTQNLVYKVEKKVFTNWWQATLNEAEKENFTISTNGRTLVYRAI